MDFVSANASMLTALIGGLVILGLGGDFLVRSAGYLADRYKISRFLTAIIIIGFGTSLPEFFVSVTAAVQGTPSFALGNIVGSNIANIWLVLAVPALIFPIAATANGERRAFTLLFIATFAWILIAASSDLTAIIGVGLLVGFAAYFLVMLIWRPAPQVEEQTSKPEGQSRSLLHIIGMALIGIIALPIGAYLIVDGGSAVASAAGVSQAFIGLTLLAIGTSLPELGAAIAAGLRRRGESVLGSVLGSNVFNLLLVGGIVSLFGPVDVAATFTNYDHWALGASVLMLGLFILPRSRISRLAAIAMLLLYGIYMYGLLMGWDLSAGLTSYVS